MPAASDRLNGSPTRSRAPLFGFGEGTTEEETDDLQPSSLPSPATSPELLPREELEQDSADDWADETDPSESAPDTRSRESSSDVEVGVLDSDALRDVFRGGVIIAGDQAHNLLASSEGQKAVGLYATDEEDAQRIGDPLARIAGRHQGVGKVNPDTADLLAAMVGLTRYATKQITKGQQAKQLDAGYSAQPAEPVDL